MPIFYGRQKCLSHAASSFVDLINSHELELFLSQTIFDGPKGVQAIEVRLYVITWKLSVVFNMRSSKVNQPGLKTSRAKSNLHI